MNSFRNITVGTLLLVYIIGKSKVTSSKLNLGACMMAKVCHHDNVDICGRNNDGKIRRFLDDCDLVEYNCIKGTGGMCSSYGCHGCDYAQCSTCSTTHHHFPTGPTTNNQYPTGPSTNNQYPSPTNNRYPTGPGSTNSRYPTGPSSTNSRYPTGPNYNPTNYRFPTITTTQQYPIHHHTPIIPNEKGYCGINNHISNVK